MRKPQTSVTTTIARAMTFILLLSVTTTGVTIFALFSSLDDAGAINIAGSLRMQSYRLAFDIETESDQFDAHLLQYEQSIHAPALESINSWITPQSLIDNYNGLTARWLDLQPILRSDDKQLYLDNIAEFVNQIDKFVLELQTFSEFKLEMLTLSYGLGFTLILMIAFYTIFYTQRKVVYPLTQLVMASKQVQAGNFRVKLTDGMQNELGILANAFNNMASELEKLYSGLESKVQEKTRRLEHAKSSLETLYGCSQELSISYLGEDNFRNILQRLLATEGLTAIRMVVEEEPGVHWDIEVGSPSLTKEWHEERLSLDDDSLGRLEWQNSLPCPDIQLIRNVAQILARGVYYNRSQKQTQQLLLMEERATIARELHDSIAQSLSYLKIQTTLLNRSLAKENLEQASITAKDIEQQLSDTYTQLRELLSTFRLTVGNASFGEALKELLDPLTEQTNAELILDNQLASVSLRANHQVHVLQIIREAVLNAIKHAKANRITINCLQQNSLASVTITDNGVGFCTDVEKTDHYGLGIMTERADRLEGQLKVNSIEGGGCQVQLLFPLQK
ncbi:nitrate/nitrite two-component system sensor histidine kinase NarQ [Vibrio albus]|uniref:Sensor protein n=1 Tax=Vibrio albus TaxID=2200953 RepID=A0A2U3B8V3_9VIBR|nr:nitrate/nitrite two-component system sensor histidine kinase NarQ [Vibrio albus]PWI33212.1 nitrate/nitrite two-component system sensor histidine kinase NarQ [Vibrio albus]